ncbi:HEAT repeat protein-like protein [Phaeosphaeriaceae sp. PMI808]|nr:HEAT repeat protein-like protein [Phaeosphaeriaceae sp. PMI808]
MEAALVSDAMLGGASNPVIPIPESNLRNLARSVQTSLPNFTEKDPATGVKELHAILDPILETASLPDLNPGHRAAASNALCAVIECCQASTSEYVRIEILEDSVWLRSLEIYLQRSDNAKGKSMRQILLVLASVVTKDASPQALATRKQAATTFLDIICERQDRIKVKPALQGLAHFLHREVVTIPELVDIYDKLLIRSSSTHRRFSSVKTLFQAFLAWIVHHDTSLSAGHLVKSFLSQARKLPNYFSVAKDGSMWPLWIEPLVWTLHDWPDRMQEFKTHVFPHCFLPNIDEYIVFLSYMNFGAHVQSTGILPKALRAIEDRENGLVEPEEFKILLAAVEAGKELTIIRDNDYRVSNTIKIQQGAICLPDDIFGPWVTNPKPGVRLAGMFLSVYSTAITRPMTGGLFNSLRRNLIHLHTDTDANFRREAHGYTQKLFDRLRASTATLAKGTVKANNSKNIRLPIPQACFNQTVSSSRHLQPDPLLESLTFVVWYVRFLEWELRSTASYQRRITALQSLTIVLRSGLDARVPHSHLSKSAQGQLNWAHGLAIANSGLTRALMDLILDPFDDVRDSAVSVLQLCLLAQPIEEQNAVLATIPLFLDRAETVQLRTGRADQADGVARAYSLLFSLLDNHPGPSNPTSFSSSLAVFSYLTQQLRNTILYAEQNLSEAVNGRPVHGTFAALRFIIDRDQFYRSLSVTSTEPFGEWEKAHGNILEYIESFWVCIQHILCADAPEGLVPDEIDETSSLDTKEILSYSWRGLKEASVLLRVIITRAPISDDEHSLLTPAHFERLGRLCFTQLLELRHRGAFSTVSQTFAAFCRRCASSAIPALRALPEIWYQETFRSIQDKAGAITRRSAGIPALMASIIAADTGQLFPRAMKELVAEASVEAQSANIEESRLPQVHALNCVKEFFTTSRLNVASEAYMGQGLELAAQTLNSKIWPIRNCSLMLFKALIERLLGSDEAQDWKEQDRAKTSRFSYDNYPSLVDILSDLLNPEGPLKKSTKDKPDSSSPLDLHGAEGVFPALQILRQARPPADSMKPIMSFVERLFGSPHWHLRDMAARTVVSLCSTHELHNAIFTLLSAGNGSHNLQHGTLLAAKYMIRKLLQDPEDLSTGDFCHMMGDLSEFIEHWYISSSCSFVRSTFLDIVSLCGMAILRRPISSSILLTWQGLTSAVSIGPDYAFEVSKVVGDALLRQSLAQVFFIDRIILRDDSLKQMILKEYQGIGDALMLLATDDPDSCCMALETIDNILTTISPNGVNIPLDLVMAYVHRVILHATDTEVISKAQDLLANSLTNDFLKTTFFTLITEPQVLLTLTKLENQCLSAPPSNTQSALHLLGFFLDHAYAVCTTHLHLILHKIARYIRLLRMTIIDTNPFDMRFAAAQSISALSAFWAANPTSKSTSPLILGLSLILHDMLSDDDDEIRDTAAQATTSLLRAQSPHQNIKNTVPILASHHLAMFLSNKFRSNNHLALEAMRRLTNTPPHTPLFATPFSHTLEQERKEDTALFASEKQNLYKDDVLDAVLWSRVLASVRRPDRATDLAVWVLDALAHLTRVASDEADGPLGWSSKGEVFALGMRDGIR